MRKIKLYLWCALGFILWVLYFIITSEARNKYMMGVQKGKKVDKIKHHLFSYSVYYSRTEQPYREYATWREFWHTWLSKIKKDPS